MLPAAALTVMLLVRASPLPSLMIIAEPVAGEAGSVTAVASPVVLLRITTSSVSAQVTAPAAVTTRMVRVAAAKSTLKIPFETEMPVPARATPKLDAVAVGKSEATRGLKVGAPAEPLGAAKTCAAVCDASVAVKVPELVTGELLTVKMLGRDKPTELTICCVAPLICAKNPVVVVQTSPLAGVVGAVPCGMFKPAPVVAVAITVTLLEAPVKVLATFLRTTLLDKAESLTLPDVLIVASFVSAIAALAEMSALTIDPVKLSLL